MKSPKIKLMSVLTASALLLSSCSSIIDSGYIGYKKNEMKYGKGVTKQFDNAIENGNVEWLGEILTKYPDFDVNYCGNIMREYMQAGSYLHETIMIASAEGNGGDENLLKYLFENGLDPNIGIHTAGNGNLLALVSKGTDMDLFNMLLENNVDVNINGNSRSALYWAGRDSLEKTKILIEKGANLSTELFENFSYVGEEPLAMQYLMKYCIENNVEIPLSKAEQYAVLGENELLTDELRKSQLFESEQIKTVRNYILFCCSPETLQVFNQLYPNYALNNIAYDTFLKMITTDNIEMIKYSIENDLVDIDDYCIRGMGSNVLAHYAAKNDMDMCKYIIEKELFDKKSAGIEMLNAAFDSRNFDEFVCIIDMTNCLFDLNEYAFCFISSDIEWSEFTKSAMDYLREKYGLSMLCIPLQNLDVETAKYLYDNGKELFPLDLQCAISMNDVQMVKLVLDKGADPNQRMYGDYFTRSSVNEKDFIYDTPYNKFISSDIEKTDEYDLYAESCLALAISHSNSQIVKLLVDYGADLNNQYLLYRAVYDTSKATFDVLFNAGASLDYRNDEDKETLVDLAKSMGRDDIVKILKEAGVKAY